MDLLIRAFGRFLAVPKDSSPVPEVTILLRQVSSQQRQHGVTSKIGWDISIHCNDNEPVRTVSLPDPSMPSAEENLRWYLEEFAIKFPFERSRSHEITAELRAYARRLINDLNLQALLQNLRSKLQLPKETLLTVFLDVEAEIGSVNNSIHSLHWEILEDMSVWPEQTRQQVIVRRRVPDLGIMLPVGDQGSVSVFNILVVVARDLSRGEQEIGHTLVTAGIIKVIGELPSKTPVNLEIVRPGTWDALRRHLVSRPKGYFSLVHFDMHGCVRIDGSTGTTNALLCFVADHDYMSVTWKSSQDVAALLCEYQIPSVILNACNSADTSGESVALTLIKYGVSSVVAMSYQFLADATSLFMSGFYRSLLVDMSSFAIAAHKGRKQLLDHKLRESSYNCQVPLDDYIVPVLYERESACSLDWGKLKGTSSKLLKHVDAPKRVVGRELDILRLEVRLLTDSNVLLVTGRRGVGKTTLLKHVGWWWGTTSLIERFHYIDLSESSDSFSQFLVQLQQFTGGWARSKPLSELVDSPLSQSLRQSQIYKQVLQYMRQNRHLLVIDGIELWAPELTGMAADDIKYRNYQRQLMKEFLEDLRGGRSLIIATVGLNQTWLDWRPYILSGLDSHYMKFFLPIDLESLGLEGCDGPDAEFWEFYSKILEYLDGVPGALDYFTYLLPITVDSNPKDIYLAMIRIVPGYDGPYTEESQCYQLVKKLKELTHGDSDAFSLLCSLAPFQDRVPINMELYLIYLSVNCVFSERLNLHFTPQSELEACENQLASSPLLAEHKLLIQRLVQLDFLTLDEARPDIYYVINPILTLALRKVVWGQGALTDSRLSWLITSGFYDYHKSPGNPIYQDLALNHRGPDSRIQLERANIFSLMLSLLEQKNLLPLLSILPVPLYLNLILDSSTFTAQGPDSFLIKTIASLAILQFDTARVEVAPEDMMVLYLFAYQCSNNLCAFYAGHGAEEFQKQVEISNEFSEIGKSLPDTARHSILFLDFNAAELTAQAARVRRSGTRRTLYDTAGDVFQGNRAAAEIYRTDPRLVGETAEDVASGVEPFKRLFRLQKEFQETNNSWTPNEEKETIQVAVKACCDELRGSGSQLGLDPMFVDSWMTEFEASVEIVPYSTVLETMAVAEEASQNSIPMAAIVRAIQKRDIGDILGAKDGLLAALERCQDDACPEGEYICHTYLSELSYVTQKWADAIGHTTEGMKLIDVAKASESEFRRQTLRACSRGQNAVCHAHLGQWDQAIDEELCVLQQCRQNPDDGVLGLMYYDTLVFLKYLVHKSGCQDIMSAEENRRERYQVLMDREGFVVDSEETRRDEEARSMFCLVATMTPKLQMSMIAQAALDGIPRVNGILLFVPTNEPLWWEAVPDNEVVPAEMKAYFTLSFTDPESAFYGMDPEGG